MQSKSVICIKKTIFLISIDKINVSTLLNTNKHDDIMTNYYILTNIDDVMVSVLASSAVDRGWEPRSGQTKNYKIGIC